MHCCQYNKCSYQLFPVNVRNKHDILLLPMFQAFYFFWYYFATQSHCSNQFHFVQIASETGIEYRSKDMLQLENSCIQMNHLRILSKFMRSLDVILWRLLIYLKWFPSVRVSKVNIRHCVTSVCGDILIHIFPHSDWMQKDILRISPYSVWMRENTEQNYTGYGPFLRSVEQLYHINYNTKDHNCLTYFDCTVLWHIASVWVQSFIYRQKRW